MLVTVLMFTAVSALTRSYFRRLEVHNEQLLDQATPLVWAHHSFLEALQALA